MDFSVGGNTCLAGRASLDHRRRCRDDAKGPDEPYENHVRPGEMPGRHAIGLGQLELPEGADVLLRLLVPEKLLRTHRDAGVLDLKQRMTIAARRRTTSWGRVALVVAVTRTLVCCEKGKIFGSPLAFSSRPPLTLALSP